MKGCFYEQHHECKKQDPNAISNRQKNSTLSPEIGHFKYIKCLISMGVYPDPNSNQPYFFIYVPVHITP